MSITHKVLQDDVLARLLTFPNVIVTAHQAFLTHEALTAIAHTTLENVMAFEEGRPLRQEVGPDLVLHKRCASEMPAHP
jgi:D-lactate dehydrogenase